MNKIIPAILEKNQDIFDKKINKLKGVLKRIHIDLIDEEYGNKSLKLSKWGDLKDFNIIGIHMMTKNPLLDLEKISELKNPIIYGHIERIKSFEGFVTRCVKRGFVSGMAIDLDTKIGIIKKNDLKITENFLLLSVKAGFSGQMFDDKVLVKIKTLRRIVGDNAEIIIDGGINLENGKKCFDAGADGLAVNSFLWNNFEENFRKLESL